MLVLARHSLAAHAPAAHAATGRLLLEGDWPSPARTDWSLDGSFDARLGWIDSLAADLAARAGPSCDLAPGGLVTHPWRAFAWLQALPLRYLAVKLLRPVIFFSEVQGLAPGETLHLVLERGRDDDYAALFAELAGARRVRVREYWVGDLEQELHVEAPIVPPAIWRRWAGRIERRGALGRRDDARAVCLAGNPRLLEPVCEALLETGASPCWLTERFAVGIWRDWRRRGVRQLVCDSKPIGAATLPVDLSDLNRLECRGVALGPAFAVWMAGAGALRGAWQLGWLRSLWSGLAALRPECIVLDEDATPWKRAIVAVARSLAIRTLVMQHGAPCVSFGFAPLAADAIAVWNDASRRQLLNWGAPEHRMHIVGAPQFGDLGPISAEAVALKKASRPKLLVLATLPPRDDRPDSIEFHLTSATHRDMLRGVFAAALARDLEVHVKPHPRATSTAAFASIASEFPGLRWKLAPAARLDVLWRAVDCVVSFASTAGIEAARSGVPVLQVLPAGSGAILPSRDWGLTGTARSAEQFARLLDETLGTRGDGMRTATPRQAFDAGRTAARRLAECAMGDAGRSPRSPAVPREGSVA